MRFAAAASRRRDGKNLFRFLSDNFGLQTTSRAKSVDSSFSASS